MHLSTLHEPLLIPAGLRWRLAPLPSASIWALRSWVAGARRPESSAGTTYPEKSANDVRNAPTSPEAMG